MPELRITHPDELLSLSTLPLQRRRGSGRISIADERVERAQRERWEGQLNKLYFACGCPEGAMGMLVGLAAWAVFAAVSTPSIGATIGLALAFALVGSGAGKLIGLVRANNALKRTVTEVRREWDAPVREEKQQLVCG